MKKKKKKKDKMNKQVKWIMSNKEQFFLLCGVSDKHMTDEELKTMWKFLLSDREFEVLFTVFLTVHYERIISTIFWEYCFQALVFIIGGTFFTCEKFPQRLSDCLRYASVGAKRMSTGHSAPLQKHAWSIKTVGTLSPLPLPTFKKVGQNFYGKTSFSRLQTEFYYFYCIKRYEMGNTFYTEWKNEKMHLCNMFKNIMIWLWNLLQYFANKVEKNTCQQMIFHVYWITLWHTSEDTEGCGIQKHYVCRFFWGAMSSSRNRATWSLYWI